MASIALGFTQPEGREPALAASTCSPCMRAKASAIWLRLVFSTQTKSNRTFFDIEQIPTAARATKDTKDTKWRGGLKKFVLLRVLRVLCGFRLTAWRRPRCPLGRASAGSDRPARWR